MNKVVFLDRDGTINVDHGYVSKVSDFALLPHAIKGIRKMIDMGYMIIVMTNQSGIGRGYYTLDEFKTVTEHMMNIFEKEKITITDQFYCPHSPESNCSCRKPGTLMFENAIKKWDIDLKKSFMIGDKKTDILAGQKMGLTTICISSTANDFNADHNSKDLIDAAEFIKLHEEKHS